MIKRILKILIKLLIIILLLIIGFLIVSFIRHKISLETEKPLREPLSELVEVDGHNMSIYTEGKGEHTIIFLSGGGTCSPILDFKSLYSLLTDEYKIVVIEKFGYGFSDIVDEKRDIATILRQTRAVLEKLKIEPPYILCPHSISGIEALYWAQNYPDEIEAIIGLDMSVPGLYQNMDFNFSIMKLGHYGALFGITRWIPNIAESEAIKHGTLTAEEKDIYRAIFYSRTATITMINEVLEIKSNAEIVEANGVPNVSMLLFISNAEGTTFDEKMWRDISKEYIANLNDAQYIELDCPHYVHDYLYQEISVYIKEFINNKLKIKN